MPRKSAHLVKGSAEAKRHMAKLRAMRSGSGIKHKRKTVTRRRVGGAVSLASKLKALRAKLARL